MKRLSKLSLVTLIILGVTLLFNLIVWTSVRFCDWYTRYIFSTILKIYGGFTSLFPFSVGEVMIVVGVVLVILFIASLVCLFFKGNIKTLAVKYMKIFALVACIVAFVMTSNCFVLYHTTGFAGRYLEVKDEYTVEELCKLREKIVVKCNELSHLMPRGADGRIIYEKNIEEEAVRSLRSLGSKYPELLGYYPHPKKIFFSGFMSQQYVAGVFFPFSMEANINDIMYIPNKPATMCHELSHIKGFIYEDEANLIAYLACINSEDLFFQYSGYLSVLYYVDNAYWEAIGGNPVEYMKQVQIEEQVDEDDRFLTPEAWAKVEGNAVVSTEIVEQVSDIAIDTSLVVNGVAEGIDSYSYVVRLLLAID